MENPERSGDDAAFIERLKNPDPSRYRMFSDRDLDRLADDFLRYLDAVQESLEVEEWSDDMISDVRGAILCLMELGNIQDPFVLRTRARLKPGSPQFQLEQAVERWRDVIMFKAEAEGIDSTAFRYSYSDLVGLEAMLYRVELRMAARRGLGLPDEDPSPLGNLFARLNMARIEAVLQSRHSAASSAVQEAKVWTQQMLTKWGPGGDRISPRTFGDIRKIAGVEPSSAGYQGQKRLYTPSELKAMIAAVGPADSLIRREARDHWQRLLAKWEDEERAK